MSLDHFLKGKCAILVQFSLSVRGNLSVRSSVCTLACTGAAISILPAPLLKALFKAQGSAHERINPSDTLAGKVGGRMTHLRPRGSAVEFGSCKESFPTF